MTAKAQVDWFERAFTALCIIGFLLIAFFALRALNDNRTVVGSVIKLWAADGGLHGADYYAVVETAAGERYTATLFTWEYGQLDIGAHCTFEIDHWNVAQSMSCDYGGKR